MTTDPHRLSAVLSRSPRARHAAVEILAHLYRAMLERYPLILVPSGAEKQQGGEFSTPVDFALQALPARLARRCRAGRFPEDALRLAQDRQLDLMILDAGTAQALAPREAPVHLDQDGEPLTGGPSDPLLLDYAEEAVTVVLDRPDLLAAFGARFDALLGEDLCPNVAAVGLAPTVYRLTVVFGSEGVGAPGALRRHLMEAAAGKILPWSGLIRPEEWTTLNRDDLSALLLTLPTRLSPGEQALQTAAVAALSETSWRLVDSSPPWRRPSDPRWRNHVLDLAGTAPSLVPAALLCDIGRGLSLEEVPEPALAPLLQAELDQDGLWRRRFQADALARVARIEGLFPILAAGTRRGDLDSAWLERLTSGDERISTSTALSILSHLPVGMLTGDLLAHLIERLIDDAARCGPELARAAIQAAGRLDLSREIDLLPRLLDLAGRGDPVACRQALGGLWPSLAALEQTQARHRLLEAITAGHCGCIRDKDLLDEEGRPRLPWITEPEHVQVLLARPNLLQHLAPEGLLRLIERHPDDPRRRKQIYDLLDHWMQRDAKRTMGALIQASAWLPWRMRAELSEKKRHMLAILWMSHPAHEALRSAPRRPPKGPWFRGQVPDAYYPSGLTMETWNTLIGDLVGGLKATDAMHLIPPEGHWPMVYPFERRQLADLAGLCRDLAPLALLADRLDGGAQPLAGMLLAASRFSEWISFDAFAWLLHPPAAGPGARRAPTLDESDVLCQYGGERKARALEARTSAVLAELARAPEVAIAAADSPSLWAEAAFRRALRTRLVTLSPSAGLPTWVTELERHLETAPRQRTDGAGGGSDPDCDRDCRRLICLLVRTGLTRVAGLITSSAERIAQDCRLLGRVYDALRVRDPNARVWAELAVLNVKASRHGGVAAEKHPLHALAGMILADGAAPVAPTGAETHQRVFTQALRAQPALLSPSGQGTDAWLPGLHLAAAIGPDQGLDKAVLHLMDSSVLEPWIAQPGWRQALLQTLRRSPHPNHEAAIAQLRRRWYNPDSVARQDGHRPP